MTSAAFPRSLSRFDPAGLLRRDWRIAALLGVIALALVVGVVQGQIARGDRGITPINSSGDFLTGGIQVDVTGDNADDAREKGWREAQRKAWAQLYRKTNGSDGPALGDSVLDGIVTAIVVEREQIGPRRYVATLGVQFDRVRAGQILGVSGRTLRSPPLLVIPVYSIDGLPQVFEHRSAWQRAWAEYNTGQSAIDYVRTAGTGVDTLLLNAGQTGRRGRVWWRVILDQYGAADVLTPIARVEYSYPGGPVTGHFTARFGPDNKLISSFTMTGPSPRALPDMMEKAVARMDEIYTQALAAGVLRTDTYLVLEKPVAVEELPEAPADGDALPAETDSSTAATTPSAGAQSFTVQYNSPDVESVSSTERAVAGVSGVQSASTSSLALGGTSVMRVTFRGDGAALKAALEARGFKVQGSGNTFRISR
ncbi:heavy-metal-associated domain-containing protein [Sphingopyxis sp. YF1]|uniref:heavy-metal-associated domain-containing protein n=1 Tax=Sphingopyxis sp. YF1 TaxID=2482763 RepID=UPI001F601DCF|nr:heavy-metal-associated domain-containing protein [Sphingopyxis sp. YF1]UNU42011.1 heavy-metal-associated domain-containing protein [Sphingopyxis sp. YF1]